MELPYDQQFHNSTPKYIWQINEFTCPCKILYMNVHSNIVHNSPKVKASLKNKTATEKWNVVYVYNRVLFSHKKECTTATNHNMDESGIHHAQWKKPDIKDHVLFDSIYMTCPKQANPQRERVDVEKAMAPHSSPLAWRSPWTEEPGGLQSKGSRRVGHDWATSLSIFTFMHWRRKWQPTPVFLPGESQGRGSLVGCRLWDHTESDMTEVT